MRRRLRARLLWVHGGPVALDDVIVEGVLVVPLDAVDAVQAGGVGVVVAEEKCRIALGIEYVVAQIGMAGFNDALPCDGQPWPARLALPRPGITEPELRQQVEHGRFRP